MPASPKPPSKPRPMIRKGGIKNDCMDLTKLMHWMYSTKITKIRIHGLYACLKPYYERSPNLTQDEVHTILKDHFLEDCLANTNRKHAVWASKEYFPVKGVPTLEHDQFWYLSLSNDAGYKMTQYADKHSPCEPVWMDSCHGTNLQCLHRIWNKAAKSFMLRNGPSRTNRVEGV